MNADERRRLWNSRVLRSHEEAEPADAEFWQRMTPNERIAVLWGLTLEAMASKGEDGAPSRLQRTVVNVQRP